MDILDIAIAKQLAAKGSVQANQGSENEGKFLGISGDGSVVPVSGDPSSVTAGDVSYNGSTNYSSGTVGKAVKDLQSDTTELDTDVSQLKSDIAKFSGAFGALLTALEHVAWTNENGQTYYDAIHDILYPLISIDAVYTQSGTVYTTDSLDSLKENLVVTATYSDGNTKTVASADYTLSGTLTVGTSTITVIFGEKTDTFTVTVTNVPLPAGYTAHDFIYNTESVNGAVISTGLAPTYNGMAYEHEIEFMFQNAPSTSAKALYGLRNTTGSDPKSRAIWAKTENSTPKLACNYGGTDTGFVYTISTNTKYKSVTKNGQWYINGVLAVDNLDTGSYVEPSSGYIGLFGILTGIDKGSPTVSGTRIYSFKVTEISSGTVIANLLPCVNSNSVAGFYDTVRETFYTTADGTKVAAGDDA